MRQPEGEKSDFLDFNPPVIVFFVVILVAFMMGWFEGSFDVFVFSLAALCSAWIGAIYFKEYEKSKAFYIVAATFVGTGLSAFVYLSRWIEGFGPLAYVLSTIGFVAFLWMSNRFGLVTKKNSEPLDPE